MIHPTADVSPDSHIGAGTQIWHGTHVREGASIGSQCVLGEGVYVDVGVVVGNNCKLQNGVFVYRPAVLEDGVFLGPGVIVTNDRVPRAVHPDGSVKQAEDWAAEAVLIRTGAAVGAACVLLAGVTIGRWALLGAGTVVIRDVPDHGLVVGNPGRLVGYVCGCGARLQGPPDETGHRCEVCAAKATTG